MKIGIIQMDIKLGNPDSNYKKVTTLTEEIMQQKERPGVIVLPELWTTGYAFNQIEHIASIEGKESADFLGKLSKHYGVWFVGGSIIASTSRGYVNRAQVINPNGELIAIYDKIHLFGLMNEDNYFVNGEKIDIFNLNGITSSCVICYDIRFCELIRKIALSKVELLFVSAEWPHPRLDHWRTLLMARAIENQMYVVACNRVGKSGENIFIGHSMVINPWGKILGELIEEKEGFLIVDIDLSIVEEVRNKIPVFNDRRPEVYNL
jgi:omega-amidase